MTSHLLPPKRFVVILSFFSLFFISGCLGQRDQDTSVGGQKSSDTPPLKALFVTGGIAHFYSGVAPFLTAKISELVNVKFDMVWVKPGVLKDPRFADRYDLIVYDFCLDDSDSTMLTNALQTGRNGKPTIFIHCATAAFRNSKRLTEWESYVGLSHPAGHDPFYPVSTIKVNANNPITKNFPDDWESAGDEVYQAIELKPGSEPLLTVTRNGPTANVAWIHTYGKGGRVFGTTLGHNFLTAQSPAYQWLLANAMLWVCDKLGEDGKPKPGYAAVHQ